MPRVKCQCQVTDELIVVYKCHDVYVTCVSLNSVIECTAGRSGVRQNLRQHNTADVKRTRSEILGRTYLGYVM